MFPVPDKIAILLDGGFAKKVLQRKLSWFPEASEVLQICTDVRRRQV